jgi:hypothetical protein
VTYGLRDIDGRRVELCDECGFDGREEIDTAARLAVGYSTLRLLVARDGSQRRPAEDTWSGVEYGDHIVTVTSGIVGACRQALGLDEAPRWKDLAAAGEGAAEFAAGLSARDAAVGVDLWPFEATVQSACVHLLHDLEHHVLDVRKGLAALGLAAGTEVVTNRR